MLGSLIALSDTGPSFREPSGVLLAFLVPLGLLLRSALGTLRLALLSCQLLGGSCCSLVG